MPSKLSNIPAVETADAWDIGSVQVYNHGTGADKVDFVIEALYGKETATLDPALDPGMGVHLFDAFTHKTLLNAKFGVFCAGIDKAVAAGKIDKERAAAFKGQAIAKFLSTDVPLASEAIALATLASVELGELGIALEWPQSGIAR
jgi:hypothetical protein